LVQASEESSREVVLETGASCEMTRNRWLALGVFAAVAVTAVVLSRQDPARIDAV
jgi:hypothetical protein